LSSDVRIDPEVSTETVAGAVVRVSALFLGGIPRGAAIVVAGPEGLRPVEAVDTMNALAQHGYESVMAEPFGAGHGDDAGRELVRHLVQRIAVRGWTHEQMGIIGYGQGARVAMVASSEGAFGAAVSLPRDVGQVLGPDRVLSVCTPWLGLTGIGERGDVADELRSYRGELETSSTEHASLIGYPGVAHCLDDSVEALVHQAAYDSWQRTVEWLNIHVAPRPSPLVQAWDERRALDQSAHH
jgi:dienelactone hydrolase